VASTHALGTHHSVTILWEFAWEDGEFWNDRKFCTNCNMTHFHDKFHTHCRSDTPSIKSDEATETLFEMRRRRDLGFPYPITTSQQRWRLGLSGLLITRKSLLDLVTDRRENKFRTSVNIFSSSVLSISDRLLKPEIFLTETSQLKKDTFMFLLSRRRHYIRVFLLTQHRITILIICSLL
jgi:hypothetical protein